MAFVGATLCTLGDDLEAILRSGPAVDKPSPDERRVNEQWRPDVADAGQYDLGNPRTLEAM